MCPTCTHNTGLTVPSQDYLFGPWTIHASEVFATSPLSYAFVNLKPVVPGARAAPPRPRYLPPLPHLSSPGPAVAAAVRYH